MRLCADGGTVAIVMFVNGELGGRLQEEEAHACLHWQQSFANCMLSRLLKRPGVFSRAFLACCTHQFNEASWQTFMCCRKDVLVATRQKHAIRIFKY